MIAVGWTSLGLGLVLVVLVWFWRPDDDRRLAHALFAAFVLAGVGLAILLLHASFWEPIGATKARTGAPAGLVPVAGAPLWLPADDGASK